MPNSFRRPARSPYRPRSGTSVPAAPAPAGVPTSSQRRPPRSPYHPRSGDNPPAAPPSAEPPRRRPPRVPPLARAAAVDPLSLCSMAYESMLHAINHLPSGEVTQIFSETVTPEAQAVRQGANELYRVLQLFAGVLATDATPESRLAELRTIVARVREALRTGCVSCTLVACDFAARVIGISRREGAYGQITVKVLGYVVHQASETMREIRHAIVEVAAYNGTRVLFNPLYGELGEETAAQLDQLGRRDLYNFQQLQWLFSVTGMNGLFPPPSVPLD